jgi:hypothetical protein
VGGAMPDHPSALKAHFGDLSEMKMVERETFLVVEVEEKILAVELFGRATFETVSQMMDEVLELRGKDPHYASVLLIDGLSGWDTELRYIYSDPALREEIAPITIIVTKNTMSKMVVNTMALGASLLGGKRIQAKSTIGQALTAAQSALKKK